MKIAYLDCFSGISGDMCLGALVGAGVDLDVLREHLARLPVHGYEIRREKIRRGGLAAENIVVEVFEPDQPERHLGDIEGIIGSSDLPEAVKAKSIAVFRCLAEAEARVHGIGREEVHFHEVGAVDAVVDVVGTVTGFALLGVEKVYASPLPLGRGFIRCRHGLVPSPAPATLEILKNVPVYGTAVEAELVTPTGAALAATLAGAFVPFPSMVVTAIGYGSGKTDLEHPNLLRLVVGEACGDELPPAHAEDSHTHRDAHDHGEGHSHPHPPSHGHTHTHGRRSVPEHPPAGGRES